MQLIIGLAVKYIDDDLTLGSLLILNKQTNLKVSNAVYKQALLFSQMHRLHHKRLPIWECLLKFVRYLVRLITRDKKPKTITH